jgi:RNA chaperone Hfq
MHMELLDTLQTPFIDNLILNKFLVSVYLKNSICLKGHLIYQDEKSILLRNGGIQKIHKAVISTICSGTVLETY